ncbi:MAG: hypothetical protein M3Q78_06490 [Acidobacteriota bacterium]|nr:hypothetical protein [Acidobacteriota bacterium]
MNLAELWNDLWQEQRALMFFGAAFGALLLILAAISLFDAQPILGINRWIKPMKFAVSIAIFLWTMAIYLNFLPGFETSKRVVAWGVIAMLIGEIVIIVMQAARGTTSHFNNENAFDGAMFSLMGLMVSLSTLLVIYLTWLYFRADFNLPTALVWGMRLGLILFLLASFEGAYMSAQLGHTVGAADGGAGLPVVNWSKSAGDLRVAHFIGMHALQMIPLAALGFVWLQNRAFKFNPTVLTFAFALFYLAAFSFVFIQAMQGKSLLAIEKIQAGEEFKK